MFSLAATFCHAMYILKWLNHVLFNSEVAKCSDAAKWCLMLHFMSWKISPCVVFKASLIRVCCMLLLYCNIYSNKCSTLRMSLVVFITGWHIFSIKVFVVSGIWLHKLQQLHWLVQQGLLCIAVLPWQFFLFNLKELWHKFRCSALNQICVAIYLCTAQLILKEGVLHR